ncbi:hypothetical protein [Galbibacter pacificus]|uniref:Uncharacterized protein n=1 Tax=Galbibacter pacificus TaxID=2996052 RepID=A0ABT6FQE0_9FLAO|nr:hypothetical protein [Galbibacter pacificus]MDG3582043.1 hypothetical protein [Galbibacter pacificus]MDG3585483.1 hypothetical protein [Galbibacter pacificus]
MRNYFQVLKLIKETLEADNLVNTVTQGDIADVDLDKKNIYPLTHIQTGAATLGLQTISFSITVFAMDIRDKRNQTVEEKFVGNDNEIDNMNTMLAILNRLYKAIVKLDNDVAISENPTCEPFYESRMNLLDGWAMTFDIEIPNTEIAVC